MIGLARVSWRNQLGRPSQLAGPERPSGPVRLPGPVHVGGRAHLTGLVRVAGSAHLTAPEHFRRRIERCRHKWLDLLRPPSPLMAANRSIRHRSSISPNAFDPTTAFGRPKLTDPAGPPPPVELAFETPVVQKVSSVQVRPEDKLVFDALQAWWHFRHGRRLSQWELFSVVLACAVGNRDGALHPALDVLP